MPSIKTTSTLTESDYETLLKKYMRENNLDVMNHVQIAAKLMDLENALHNIPISTYTMIVWGDANNLDILMLRQ